MVQLDVQARKHLDAYLAEVRGYLRGCQSVDPDEVDRDIREHIERELLETPEPVAAEEVRRVLKKLGNPAQWVREEELPWWIGLGWAYRRRPDLLETLFRPFAKRLRPRMATVLMWVGAALLVVGVLAGLATMPFFA